MLPDDLAGFGLDATGDAAVGDDVNQITYQQDRGLVRNSACYFPGDVSVCNNPFAAGSYCKELSGRKARRIKDHSVPYDRSRARRMLFAFFHSPEFFAG